MLKLASVVVATVEILFLWSSAAADDLTRDQLLDLVVELDKACSLCSRFDSSYPKFHKDGGDLLLESAVRVELGGFDRRAPRLRAVFLYRDKNRTESWRGDAWTLQFEIDRYRSGSRVSFPVNVICQPTSRQQIHCWATEATSSTENAAGFRNYEFDL